MNPNKCVDRVIQALASCSELKDATEYRLVGPIEPSEAQRLQAVADEQGYRRLAICGPVSEEALTQHLGEADVICCLRRPVLEGASGSAVEALLAGRPTLVADAGCYADLPSDLVFKTSSDVEPTDVAAQLKRLAADEVLRVETGAKARAWASGHFNLDAYAAAVEALILETISVRPRLQVAEHVGRRLATLGLEATDPAVPRLATFLGEFLNAGHECTTAGGDRGSQLR